MGGVRETGDRKGKGKRKEREDEPGSTSRMSSRASL